MLTGPVLVRHLSALMLMQLESAAEAVHWETGVGSPAISAFHLAVASGFRIQPKVMTGARTLLDPAVIEYDKRICHHSQQELVARELARWTLRRKGLGSANERYLAGALLLPRKYFQRDLLGPWAPYVFQFKHLHATPIMIAERIVHLHDAAATVITNGVVQRRTWSPWLPEDKFGQVSEWEIELASKATKGRSAMGDSRCYAMAHGRSVVVVCEAKQLSLRL